MAPFAKLSFTVDTEDLERQRVEEEQWLIDWEARAPAAMEALKELGFEADKEANRLNQEIADRMPAVGKLPTTQSYRIDAYQANRTRKAILRQRFALARVREVERFCPIATPPDHFSPAVKQRLLKAYNEVSELRDAMVKELDMALEKDGQLIAWDGLIGELEGKWSQGVEATVFPEGLVPSNHIYATTPPTPKAKKSTGGPLPRESEQIAGETSSPRRLDKGKGRAGGNAEVRGKGKAKERAAVSDEEGEVNNPGCDGCQRRGLTCFKRAYKTARGFTCGPCNKANHGCSFNGKSPKKSGSRKRARSAGKRGRSRSGKRIRRDSYEGDVFRMPWEVSVGENPGLWELPYKDVEVPGL